MFRCHVGLALLCMSCAIQSILATYETSSLRRHLRSEKRGKRGNKSKGGSDSRKRYNMNSKSRGGSIKRKHIETERISGSSVSEVNNRTGKKHTKESLSIRHKFSKGGDIENDPRRNSEDDERSRPDSESSHDHDDDLDIRFSKVVFQIEGVPDKYRRPLTSSDFPIHGNTAMWLRQSQCHSVIMQKDCAECDIDFESLIDAVGGYPSHPSRDPESPYWDELREVVMMQKNRREGVSPHLIMPLADLWTNFTIGNVAEAVHNEFPGIRHIDLITALLKAGVTVDATVIPFMCKVEFLRRTVMLADMNTWAVGTIGPFNFGLKYHVGRVRPEEVAWMISEGKLTSEDGVPQDIIDVIDSFHLKSPEDFTAYPEGCPSHPSWPAMHSAASASSLWLAVVLNLTEEQWCQAKLLDYNVAYARTVAGVHYQGDNIDGLNLGQEIMARKLPKYLATKYGSDPAVVKKKIASLRFDWNGFLSSTCGSLTQLDHVIPNGAVALH